MKKSVLFLSLLLGLSLYASAQIVDLYGKGIKGDSVTTICFGNPSNVTSVIAKAHFKHSYLDANGPVDYINCDGDHFCNIQACEYNYAVSWVDPFTGHFTFTLDTVDLLGVTEKSMQNLHGLYSYFLFVSRDLPAPTHYSVYSTDNVFFYRNGVNDPFVYNLTINSGSDDRTLIVTVPISELNDDNRKAVIDVTAGDKTKHVELYAPNKGESLNLTPIVLEDVDEDVTTVQVSIYSPKTSAWDGDSFITGGAVVNVLSDKHCSYTQGFYGNYGGTVCGSQSTYDLMYGLLYEDLVLGGGNNTLTLTRDGTGDDGSGDGVDCLIGRLPGGGKSAKLKGAATCDNPVGIKLHKKSGRFKNSLLSQAITLGLNLRFDVNLGRVRLEDNVMYTTEAEDCSDPESEGDGESEDFEIGEKVINYLGNDNTIDDLFALANSALAGDDISPLKLKDVTKALAAINEVFDECRLLDGFESECDDGDDDDDKNAIVVNSGIDALKVYPNPTTDRCTIAFTPETDGKTTVELYDIMGSRVGILLDKYTLEGERYSIDFSSHELTAGIYIVIVRNGTTIQKQKVSIMK